MSDWIEHVVEEGRAARKWFGDHYKEVHVANGGDFEAAKAAVDQEVALKEQGAADQARAAASDLRATADVVDPDVETPDVEQAAVPAEETPAPPVVAATSLEEIQAQHEERQAAAGVTGPPAETVASETPATESVVEEVN